MHTQSETSLRKLASQCLHKHGPDAWEIYRDEARARYAREDDGPRDKYDYDATALFLKVANGTKGYLRRRIRAGFIPMPTLPEVPDADDSAMLIAEGGKLREGIDTARLVLPPEILVSILIDELHTSLEDIEDPTERQALASYIDLHYLCQLIDLLSDIVRPAKAA